MISLKMTEEEIETENCPCPEVLCSRHGKCSKCQEYHHKLGQKTSCGK